MDQDKESIDAAYADTLKNLYKVMLSSYVAADGNKPLEKKADDSFKAGLTMAKKVRDRAFALLA